VVIFTGTGDFFLWELDFSDTTQGAEPFHLFWDRILKEGKDLINNYLDIEVPVIGVANGDAFVHSELIVISDIVLGHWGGRFALFARKARRPLRPDHIAQAATRRQSTRRKNPPLKVSPSACH